MYFQKFPQTFYSLDNRATVQVVTNFLLRCIIADEVKNNYSAYELYDVRDGETPEILAFQFYGDSNLHWIILHMNDILDPRFDWPLDTYNFQRFVDGKYSSPDEIHHYENTDGNIVSANVVLLSSGEFDFVSVGDVVVNNTYPGVGYVTEINSDSNVIVRVTSGGITAGSNVYLASNASLFANVTSTVVLSGTPVTNYKYEEEINETKRRIKVLKPQYVERVIKDLDSKLATVNV